MCLCVFVCMYDNAYSERMDFKKVKDELRNESEWLSHNDKLHSSDMNFCQ